jgi:hypothetical protein
MAKRQGEPFDGHRIRIAKSTLRMSDMGAAVMGGMSKADARNVLADLAGWSIERIQRYEELDNG